MRGGRIRVGKRVGRDEEDVGEGTEQEEEGSDETGRGWGRGEGM